MLSKICGTTLVLVACVHAQALTFNFTDLISGGQPDGPGILASLTIIDAGADTVDLTLSHSASSASGQFIAGLWLNVGPTGGPVGMSNQNPAAKFNGPWQFGLNSQNQLGLMFDGHQAFQTSGAGGGANRLKPGESVTFRLTGTGLDSSDFYSTAVPTGMQGNDVLALIHIQGVDGEPDSGHLAAVVPEPVTALVVGVGALAVAFRRRRR